MLNIRHRGTERMNTVLLFIVAIFMALAVLSALSPLIAAIAFMVAMGGLLTGNGGVAFLGLRATVLFGGLALWVEAKPVFVVNKR